MDTGWRRNYLRYKSFFLNMLTQYKERSDWKAYLEILLSLTTVSIFSIFALRPTILTIAELIRQIEEKKATVAKMDEKIQNLSKSQALYDRERSNITLLTDYVIPKKAISDIFSAQLEGLSSKYQVGISEFTLGKGVILGQKSVDKENTDEKATPQDWSNLHYSAIFTAPVENYSSIVEFLKDFENLRLPPTIKSLDLGISVKGEDKNKLLILSMEGDLPYMTTNLK